MKDSEWGRRGAKKRWSKTTPEERKAYSVMLNEAKKAKRAAKNVDKSPKHIGKTALVGH